ncbi:hypothetical protein HK096_000532, partial [Nowakowskiella sp. JEL0078]
HIPKRSLSPPNYKMVNQSGPHTPLPPAVSLSPPNYKMVNQSSPHTPLPPAVTADKKLDHLMLIIDQQNKASTN